MKISLVVVAAGNSTRMGEGVNKQFLLLKDKPVLVHTLLAFHFLPEIAEIIVVTRKDDILAVGDMIKEYGVERVKAVVPGGSTRQESVCHGLSFVTEEKVLIHDGARPFVTEAEIRRLIDALTDYEAVVPGILVNDTIKRVDANGTIIGTVPRAELMAVQTPQGFTTSMILSAHQKAKEDGVAVTDDASVAEYAGIPVNVVPGNYLNIKITTPEDILLAEAICEGR